MAPPAKRRRRDTVEAPEDEGEHQPRVNTLTNYLLSSPSSSSPAATGAAPASPSPKRTKPSAIPSSNGSPLRPTRRTQPSRAAVRSSPRKEKGSGKKEEDKGVGKTADLKTLFSKQIQRAPKKTNFNGDQRIVTLDDPISDPVSDDEIEEVGASSSSLVSQNAKKRLKSGEKGHQPTIAGNFSVSQRFLKPPRPPVAVEPLNEDLRPWSERFGPRNLDELAVHKRKVADVRKWLEDVMAGRLRQRLLVLKGAAGSGKTTTVRLLARDMDCEVLEWKNPVGNGGTGFVSASAQFEEFLGRGRKFGALDIESPEPPSSTPAGSHGSSQTVQQNGRGSGKKLILIEEFPNTFSRASSALASFRQALLQHVASSTSPFAALRHHPPTEPISPVVLVLSETLLTTTSASADSLTAHRLLGPDILSHPGVGLIEFNAVAPTLLTKALDLVVQKESRKSGRRRTPGPLVLKRLGDIGDIRSAISSLEFLCLKGDHDADWGGKVTFTRQKKGVRDAIALTRGEEESLEMVSRREASLGIFHAVGKVVYNKREELASDDAAENLPSFLSHRSRPKRSEVSVDALMDETGTDTPTFLSALHENYGLSCESTDAMDLSTPIDYVNECIEYLSQSDLLCPSRDVFFGGRGGLGGNSWDAASQLLRQDEIMFQVAVRGMLFSLPNPVRRKTRSGSTSRGSDAFKMFYPTSLKLWRAKEEIEGMVDVWTTKLLKGEEDVPTSTMTTNSGGAKLFRRSNAADGSSTPSQQPQVDAPKPSSASSTCTTSTSSSLATLGNAARREMLLDRLPYMAHMARSRKTSKPTRQLRDLEKIVSFKGSSPSADDDEAGADAAEEEEEEEDNDGDGPAAEPWATDKPSEETSPSPRSRRRRRAGIRAGAVTGLLAQKLVLSDDDIED